MIVGDPFPSLNAVSLTGRRYRLPDDLAGTPTLLLVGFHRWQQELIAGWLPPLARLEAEPPGLAVYDLAIIPRLFLPARGYIDGGLARGRRDERARARTLTVYANVGSVVAALGLRGTENVVLLLLDRDGRLAWRGRGVYDPDQFGALRDALRAIGQGAAVPEGVGA